MDIYRTVAFGPSVGQGVNRAMFLHLSAIGKANSIVAPFVIANELLAAQIGQFLKLPVPPGGVVVDPNGTPYYASMDFNITGNSLPPIIEGDFAAAFGGVAVASVLAFDILIANSDR